MCRVYAGCMGSVYGAYRVYSLLGVFVACAVYIWVAVYAICSSILLILQCLQESLAGTACSVCSGMLSMSSLVDASAEGKSHCMLEPSEAVGGTCLSAILDCCSKIFYHLDNIWVKKDGGGASISI